MSRRTALVRLSLFLAAFHVGGVAAAQELPGTSGGGLPPSLRDTYEDETATPLPPPRPAPRRPVSRPLLVVVPELAFASGYSDNVFVTPDVLGAEAVADGFVGVTPRLRALVTMTPALGLVGDYALDAQTLFDHGHSHAHSGKLFLGYRPAHHRHAELGVRGGLARLSEFEQANTNEGHVFVDGTWGWTPGLTLGGGASLGLREFPDRSHEETPDLFLGILPLPLVSPGTVRREGQEDRLANVGGRSVFRYGRTGALRFGYDFTRVDSDVGAADRDEHRVSVAGSNVWAPWLATALAYSVRFRRFDGLQPGSDPPERRKDTIHDVGLVMVMRPAFLRRLPLARTASLELRYGALVARSNVDTSELERNLLSARFEIGFPPFTAFWRTFDAPGR